MSKLRLQTSQALLLTTVFIFTVDSYAFDFDALMEATRAFMSSTDGSFLVSSGGYVTYCLLLMTHESTPSLLATAAVRKMGTLRYTENLKISSAAADGGGIDLFMTTTRGFLKSAGS